MSNFTKAIHPDEQEEQHSLSQKGRVSMGAQNQFYQQSSSSKKQNELLNKLCVTILIILLLISIGIFSYRYFELVEAEKLNKFNKAEIQTNMQSGELSQHEQGQKLHSKQKPYNYDGNTMKVTKNDGQLQNSVKIHKKTIPLSEQHVVQESSLINQNSMQYKETQGIKTQQQQILGEGSAAPSEDDDSENSHIEQQQTETENGLDSQLANVGSIQQAQLLYQKNAYNEAQMKLQQLNNIKSELSLHQKVKQHYLQLFADSEQENQESQTNAVNSQEATKDKQISNPQQNSKQVNQEFQKQSQSKNQEAKSQPNQQSPEGQETQNEPQAQQKTQKTQQKPKSISSQHITDKDLYDPIVRVKSQIQKNLNSNFDDLYYIKAGTNITEQQYKQAIERMHLWKFFNPLTKKLEILDDKDVNYEGLDISTPQATSAVLEKMERMRLQEKLEYQQKYQVSQYGEIPFCIIIPSYKNQDKYFRNLNSILQQDYENYHIIYIDDASQDGTAEKVKSYIDKYQVPESKLLFIQNKVNKKALPNIDYAARRLCNSGEIMTIIDGDDYLIGTQVFKIINARYQKKSLLVLYTNHLRVHEPIYLKVGTCIDYPEKVKKARSFRRFSIFPASHLRTFFVDLYWRISIRDLKDYQGGYFTAANDFAIMMPILEMAGDRYQYFSELTYVYDAGTGFNNFQTKADKQARNFKITKRRHKYPKLEHDLEFEKNLRAKGLMKPLPQSNIQRRAPPSSANRLRRNVRKI